MPSHILSQREPQTQEMPKTVQMLSTPASRPGSQGIQHLGREQSPPTHDPTSCTHIQVGTDSSNGPALPVLEETMTLTRHCSQPRVHLSFQKPL